MDLQKKLKIQNHWSCRPVLTYKDRRKKQLTMHSLYPIQTGIFWFFSDRRGADSAFPPPPLRDFQNIKAITMKLRGYIVCPKNYLLVYVTWVDDVTSRKKLHHNLKTAAILDLPSWISNFFQNVRKPPKITAKYSKSIKLCLKTVKR